MSKLIPIVLFSFIMAFFSEARSTWELGERRYLRKDGALYALMALGMAVFVGLRTAGNDTYTYRMMYESIPSGAKAFRAVEWTRLASAPGHTFVCACLKQMGASAQDYFMVFALFTVCTYLWFVRKYTSGIWLSVFYFITMGVYTFSMAAIKQTAAVAFLVIATDRAIEKKYVRFVLWLLVAELFHPYAFVYAIVPFVAFAPWRRETFLLLFAAAVVAFGLSRFMSGILAITDSLGEGYEAEEFLGEGVNRFRVAVVWVPVALSFLARRQLRTSEDRTANMLMNLSMVNAMIMFIGLFGTANYFARLANYFLLFQTLSLPWIFRFFNAETRRFLKLASVVSFLLYFYYASVLANGAFDDVYRFTTLGEYLRQLF